MTDFEQWLLQYFKESNCYLLEAKQNVDFEIDEIVVNKIYFKSDLKKMFDRIKKYNNKSRNISFVNGCNNCTRICNCYFNEYIIKIE
jgi:hypothetical protein